MLLYLSIICHQNSVRGETKTYMKLQTLYEIKILLFINCAYCEYRSVV